MIRDLYSWIYIVRDLLILAILISTMPVFVTFMLREILHQPTV